MSTKNNNKLPNNLPQLQNWIKRDAGSYHDEVRLRNGTFHINFYIIARRVVIEKIGETLLWPFIALFVSPVSYSHWRTTMLCGIKLEII